MALAAVTARTYVQFFLNDSGEARPKEGSTLLSDKEIAEALFVGLRTVQSHAEKIYAKLGVRNRHEATAVAVRRGLV